VSGFALRTLFRASGRKRSSCRIWAASAGASVPVCAFCGVLGRAVEQRCGELLVAAEGEIGSDDDAAPPMAHSEHVEERLVGGAAEWTKPFSSAPRDKLASVSFVSPRWFLGACCVVGIIAAACNAEKERIRAQLTASERDWYVQAWGQPPAASQNAELERRFECVWGEIARADGNPSADLRCFARRLDAQAQCYRSNASRAAADVVATCNAVAESTCPLSAAFQRAAATVCKAPKS
jgi:hypothetical protein